MRTVSNFVLLCGGIWEKIPKFTEIVNEMLYTGDRKTREVEQSRHIFRQLYGNMLLDSFLMLKRSWCFDGAKTRKEPNV